jgi:tetratricopeptide (TPR) repeat protein
MTKIAFAAIIKGTDKEAELLANLLTNVRPYVDGAFITVTQPNEKVKAVCEMYNATLSEFEWCNDFAKARNYNFSQVPEEYDYILWGDADDTFTGLDHLKQYIEENKADAYALYYHYDHDKYGMPTVVHPKTQIVANDGTFSWVGCIHEDLQADREIRLLMLEGVVRVHHTTEERVKESATRNKDIAVDSMTGDPRDFWNLANAYTGTGEYKKAIDTFKHFIEVSGSDMEIYTALLRVANMYVSLGDLIQANEYARKAIGLHFEYPDGYYTLATVLKSKGEKREAIDAIKEGLKKKPPIDKSIVYNPRDYDYNPLMSLANLYWDTAQPREAKVCLEKCREIQPKNDALEDMIEVAGKEADLQDMVIQECKDTNDVTDDEFMKRYNALSEEARLHPLMLQTRNMRFVKTESSGRDIVYYCGQSLPWTPDILKQGVGGSEEAVINLSKEFAKAGYNVTVYNNCGEEKVYDGVLYKPWYTYNYRDKQDILILWRSLALLDYDLNVGKVFVDIHDAMRPGEFTKKRVEKLTKVFLKSDAHKALYPNLSDDKVVIVPNGMDTELFDEVVERDPYLIVNTSSPDRALTALVRLFPKIKAREPRATMKWAYGWNVFDTYYKTEKDKIAWKNDLQQKMKDAGVEDVGKISHAEVAKLMLSAGVMLYPTHFYEIDCVSARKAQLAGAIPVSSDFAALNTTVKYGYKVHSDYTKETWCPAYAFDFAEDESKDDEYVDAVLKAFKDNEREPMQRWARNVTPAFVAGTWINYF